MTPEELQAQIDALTARLTNLENVQAEAKQFVPKGVNWKLTSANSASPGHTHVEADITDLTHVTTFDSLTDVTAITEAQGQVIYYDGSNWNALAVGTDGHQLITQGASANPKWYNTGERYGGNNTENSKTANNNTVVVEDFTITADDMGANGVIKITWAGARTGGANTITASILFGGSTLCGGQIRTGNEFFMEARIGNRNATNAQVGHTLLQDGSSSADGNIITDINTSSIDTTSNVTLRFQISYGAATDETLRTDMILIELVKP